VRRLRLGTRRSALATAQARLVADALASRGFEVDLVGLSSHGDRTPGPLAQIGGTGVFVAEVRQALLEKHVDLAVHSLKDLPTAPQPGVVLAAVPARASAFDALCMRSGSGLADLNEGSRVATSSPRRAAQLRKLGLRLHISDIRGNVDTRLRRVAAGDVDAIVLACAGLRRLGRDEAISEELGPDVMLPAAGQGALAVECLEEAMMPDRDAPLAEALSEALEDDHSRACVVAERSLLAALEAGCSAPVGAIAQVRGTGTRVRVELQAAVFAHDGSRTVDGALTAPLDEAAALGSRLAQHLLDSGAASLMPGPSDPHGTRPVAARTSTTEGDTRDR
jgi:hydroxymethylbilane synthase